MSDREKTAEEQKASTWSFAKTFRLILPWIRPYRKQFVWGIITIIFADAISVINPWVLKYAFEDLQRGVTAGKIYYYASIVVLIALVSGVFSFLMRRIIVSLSRNIEYDVHVQYFQHLQKLSPSFYDHQQTGDLMTRATSDVEAVRMIVGPAVMYSVDTILTTVFVLALMFALSVPLTLTVLAMAPVLSLLIYILARKIHTYSLKSQDSYSDLNSMVQEHLSGIRVVRAYNQEKPERRLFENLSRHYMDTSMELTRLQAMLTPFFYSVFGVGLAIVLYMGGKAIIAGSMTIGSFVAFSAYLAMLAWPVMAVGWVLNLYQRGAASLQRIYKILDIKPDIVNRRIDHVQELAGNIVFKHVNFAYPGTEAPALQDINLEIPAGTSLGIVGPVGSGKTSLVSLIPRLYEVTSGDLVIDGVNVADLPLEVLRRDVAMVPQESYLFSDRLDRNILFANLKLDENRLHEVAEIANLSSDVEGFPEGFSTWVGERGITLSGGQKQRTSLARALAADPRILILDDCFSSVDTRTEAEILRKIRPLLKDRTTIIIAHRISTLQWADQIIVLKEGKIAERGTHQELLALGGWYTTMYYRQLLEASLGEEARSSQP